jgi:hypothetical protein
MGHADSVASLYAACAHVMVYAMLRLKMIKGAECLLWKSAKMLYLLAGVADSIGPFRVVQTLSQRPYFGGFGKIKKVRATSWRCCLQEPGQVAACDMQQ